MEQKLTLCDIMKEKKSQDKKKIRLCSIKGMKETFRDTGHERRAGNSLDGNRKMGQTDTGRNPS